MFGYAATEALGTSSCGCCPYAAGLPLTEWLAQGEALGSPASPIELTGVHQDGREFPGYLPVDLEHGTHETYVTGTIRDLTTRKHLEEQTRQQELLLIQANKMTALGTLVAGVAHEVNNPNQLVLMNTQMLADTWDDAVPILDAYAQEAGDLRLGGLPYTELQDMLPLLIQDLHAGAQHIERIIDDLRDFARPAPTAARHPCASMTQCSMGCVSCAI